MAYHVVARDKKGDTHGFFVTNDGRWYWVDSSRYTTEAGMVGLPTKHMSLKDAKKQGAKMYKEGTEHTIRSTEQMKQLARESGVRLQGDVDKKQEEAQAKVEQEKQELIDEMADALGLPPADLADQINDIEEKIAAGEELTDEEKEIMEQAKEYKFPIFEESLYAQEAEAEARLEAQRFEEYYVHLLEQAEGDYERAKTQLDEDLATAVQEADEDKEQYLRDLTTVIETDKTRIQEDYDTFLENGEIDRERFLGDLEEQTLTTLGRMRSDFEKAVAEGDEDKATFLGELSTSTNRALRRLGEDKDLAIERGEDDRVTFLEDLANNTDKTTSRLVEDYDTAKTERDEDRTEFLSEIAETRDRLVLRIDEDYSRASERNETDKITYLANIASDENLLTGILNEDHAVATERLAESDRIFKEAEQFSYTKAVREAKKAHNLQGTYWSGLKDRELSEMGEERRMMLERQAISVRREEEDIARTKARGLEEITTKYGRAREQYTKMSEREIEDLMRTTGRSRADIIRGEEEARTKYETGYGRETAGAEKSYTRALADIAEGKETTTRDYETGYQRRMDDLLSSTGRTEEDIREQRRLSEQGFMTPWERRYGEGGTLGETYGRATEDISTSKEKAERDFLESQRRSGAVTETQYRRGLEDLERRQTTGTEQYMTAYERERAARERAYGRTTEAREIQYGRERQELGEQGWEAIQLAAERARQSARERYLTRLAQWQAAGGTVPPEVWAEAGAETGETAEQIASRWQGRVAGGPSIQQPTIQQPTLPTGGFDLPWYNEKTGQWEGGWGPVSRGTPIQPTPRTGEGSWIPEQPGQRPHFPIVGRGEGRGPLTAPKGEGGSWVSGQVRPYTPPTGTVRTTYQTHGGGTEEERRRRIQRELAAKATSRGGGV